MIQTAGGVTRSIILKINHTGGAVDELVYWRLDNAFSFFGLMVAVVSVTLVYGQLKQLVWALSNDAQARLFQQNAEIRQIIAMEPRLRKYFFNDEPVARNDELYPKVRTVAEMYANYLEHLAVLQPALKTGEPGPWSKVIWDIYDSSPIIRETLREKPHWYCAKLHDIVERRNGRGDALTGP